VTTQTTVVELFREVSRKENGDEDEETVITTSVDTSKNVTGSQVRVPLGEEMSSLVRNKDNAEIELQERESKE
jgi:hypothetical protein